MAIVYIRSTRRICGVVTTEIRYYVTTLTDVAKFAHSVRSHWGIENNLHWIQDVVFREDDAQSH